jgi:hypothetical protein
MDAAGPDATGLDATGLAGLGLAGDGLAGTGTGLAATGSDDTETAPLAKLTGTLLPGFGSEVSGMAGLAATDDGEPGTDGGVTDDGAPDYGSPSDPASALRMPGHRSPSHSQRRIRQVPSGPAGRPGGKQQGIARGVLVTPWFAAATGFVIAASLWIYAPRPQFAFPITISTPRCTPDGCNSNIDPQAVGSLPINSGQTAHPHNSAEPAGTGTPAQTHTATSGLSFGYVVRPLGADHFALTVSVTGKRPLNNWHLDFVLPGDHIQYVFGAAWKREGSHGVVASSVTGDQGQHGGGLWGAGGGYGNHGDQKAGQANQGGSADGHGGPPDPYNVSFTVIASGTPTAPTNCHFDGASCAFQKLSSLSQEGAGPGVR